jgi:hypothetical protein
MTFGHFFQFHAIHLLIVGFLSCKMNAPSRESRSSAADILKADEVSFQRINDGKSGMLRFQTKIQAACAIAYHPKSKAESDAKKMDCESGSSQTSFVEVIKDLEPEELYMILISIWPAGSDPSRALVIRVDEGTLKKTLPAIANEHTVISLSLPEMSGGVAGAKEEDIQKYMDAVQGTTQVQCGVEPLNLVLYPSSQFQQASLRGFLTAASAPSTSEGFYVMPLSSIQLGTESLTMNIKLNSDAFQIQTNEALSITSSQLTNIAKGQVSVTDLKFASDEQGLSANTNFEITWQWRGKTENSRAVLTLANHNSAQVLICTAPASAGKLKIPADAWNSFKTRAGNAESILFELEQVKLISEKKLFVRTSDWRRSMVQN